MNRKKNKKEQPYLRKAHQSLMKFTLEKKTELRKAEIIWLRQKMK